MTTRSFISGIQQATAASADDGVRKPVRFDVASVRLVSEKDRGVTSISSPGEAEFKAHNVTLTVLVGFAFGVDSGRQIVNEPAWMESEQCDVAAKVEDRQKLSNDELKLLLQNLLQDRFGLAYHRETRMHKGYALVAGKRGPKLHPSNGCADHAYILPDGISARAISLETLAALLSRPMGGSIEDKTGIAGKFDIELKYDPNEASDSSLLSLATALDETLGLKLVRQDVSEEVIVIDPVDRIPTDN